jgi:hypothetical protein
MAISAHVVTLTLIELTDLVSVVLSYGFTVPSGRTHTLFYRVNHQIQVSRKDGNVNLMSNI